MKTVLVVDDSPTLRKIVAEALRVLELNILEAEHGLEAMELLKKHKIDLILLDWHMPEMDGFDFFTRIKDMDDYMRALVDTPPAPGTAAPSAPPAPTQPTVQVTQKSGSAIGTIIGIALGVIAVIVLILVLVNQSDDTSDVPTPPTTSAETTPTSPATTVAP